jgi:hypothetical protein
MRVNASGAVQTNMTLGGVNDGAWHLLVLTFDPADKKQRYYVDDVLIFTSAATVGSSLATNTSPVSIGGWSTIAGYLNGNMSSVYIASRVWTAGERTDLWDSGDGLFYGMAGGGVPQTKMHMSMRMGY